MCARYVCKSGEHKINLWLPRAVAAFYPALLRPVQPAARCRGAAAVGGGRFLQQGAGGQGQC